MLQGIGTDEDDILVIREGLKHRRRMCVSILNYTRSGEPFWNILAIQPIFRNGTLQHFVGQIVGLPVPQGIPEPKLCLDIACAWMRCLSSGPKALPPAGSDQSLDEAAVITSELHATSSEELKGRPTRLTGIRSWPKWLAEREGSDGTRRCELQFIAETALPTRGGRFRMRAYRDDNTGEEPMALIVGQVERKKRNPCARPRPVYDLRGFELSEVRLQGAA